MAQIPLSDSSFLIITNHDELEPPVMTDSLFNSRARGIKFVVNRVDVDQKSDFFQLYRELLPHLRHEGLQLRRLYLRGAASPEGSYARNQWLGQKRTENLLKIFQSDLSDMEFSAIPAETSSITEDYGYLLTLMQEANDPDYDTVLQIYQDSQGDEKKIKQQLQSQRKLWQRLYQQYFERLRSARVVLWLTRPDPVIPASRGPMPVPATLSSDMREVCAYRIAIPEPQPLGYVPQPRVEPVGEVLDSLLVRRHLLALRTNLLYDFMYAPQFGFAPGINVQLEYYPLDGHITYNAGFTFQNHRHWEDYQFWQTRDIDLEARLYLWGHGVFCGPYAGIDAHVTWYGLGMSKTKGWEGEGYGASLTLGWVWNLSRNKRWRLEANVGVGYFRSKYDPYVYGNILSGEEDGLYYYDYSGALSQFKKRNHLLQWFGPTQAGLHLTYDILYRRIQKRGAGFRRTELYAPTAQGNILLQKGDER